MTGKKGRRGAERGAGGFCSHPGRTHGGRRTGREREVNSGDGGGEVDGSGDRLDAGAERHGNSGGWCHAP